VVPYASSVSNRRSILAATSVAILCIVAGWRIAEAFRPKTEPSIAKIDLSDLAGPADETDTDGDSVPDWQEFLIGSNPAVADKEVANARLASSTEVSASSVVSTPETSKLVDKVVTAYTGAQMTAQALTPEDIANQISSGLEAPGTYKPHLASEIKTVAINTKERAARYQEDMRKAMEPMLTFKSSEIELIGRYVAQKDPAAMSELEHIASVDDAVASAMLKVVVPTDALDRHLEAINALTYFSATLHTIVKYSNDPIASLTLLRVFNDAEKRMNAAYGQLGVYYSQMRAL
jgi:hypothetical protein